LFDWPSIGPNLNAMVATVDAFMVRAAKGLQFAKPKRRDVAAMVFAVVDDFGDGDAALGFA
jgi:hypothetical protein